MLESRVVGGGQSGRDSGELSTWNNHTYKRLESLYGAEKTTRIAASQKAALEFVEIVVKEKRINCGFSRQDAFVFFDSPSVGPEFKALLNAGLHDTKEVNTLNVLHHFLMHKPRPFTKHLTLAQHAFHQFYGSPANISMFVEASRRLCGQLYSSMLLSPG